MLHLVVNLLLKLIWPPYWNTCQLHIQTNRNCFLLKYRTRFLHNVSPKLFSACYPLEYDEKISKTFLSQTKFIPTKNIQIGHQYLLILLIFALIFLRKEITMDLKSKNFGNICLFLAFFCKIFSNNCMFLAIFRKLKSSLCFVSAWGLVVVPWCLLILIRNTFQDKGLVFCPLTVLVSKMRQRDNFSKILCGLGCCTISSI